MSEILLRQIAHIIRWCLEFIILWFLVLPETGFWTTFTLTMLTVGTEFFYFSPSDWKKNGS